MLMFVLAGYMLAAIGDQAGPVSHPGGNPEDAHVLLAKMKASRDLLRSGMFRASGAVSTNSDAFVDRPLQGKIEIFSAFDLDKGLLRFDQTRPAIRRIDDEDILDQDSSKYVRTPQLAITWMRPWKQPKNMRMVTAVGIYPPTLKPPRGIAPFDVRSLGLNLWDDFRAGIPFSKSYETWDKGRRVELFSETNGITRLRLVQGHRSGIYVPQTLWIDEHQGFSPVRLSYSVSLAEMSKPGQFTFDCHVRWKDEAGVWVPSSFRIERRVRERLVDFYSLSFEWISVNKPIEPGLFTPEGLGVPVGTQVSDYRGAVPRRVGQVKAATPLE
jgi:hypothetical protein